MIALIENRCQIIVTAFVCGCISIFLSIVTLFVPSKLAKGEESSNIVNIQTKESVESCCVGSGGIQAVVYYGDTEDIFTYANVNLTCDNSSNQGCNFKININSEYVDTNGVSQIRGLLVGDTSLSCNITQTVPNSYPATGSAYHFSGNPDLPSGTYKCSSGLFVYDCDMEDIDFVANSLSYIIKSP